MAKTRSSGAEPVKTKKQLKKELRKTDEELERARLHKEQMAQRKRMRREAEKERKLAKKPLKEEKKFNRMLKRADNFDDKAKKLTLQAKQLRERYYQLKAKREKAAQETTAAQDKADEIKIVDNVDDSSSDSGSDTPSSSDSDSDSSDSDSSADEEKAQPEKEDVVMANAEESEKPPKKSKKAKKAKDEDEVPAPKEVPKDEIAMVEEKRSEAGDDEDEGKKKKSKKSKKSEPEATEEKADKKDKKKRKREADEVEAAADGDVFVIDTGSAKKKDGKKSKKSKKATDSDEENVTKETPAQTEADGEQWNVSALEGGSARQAKFLKLLGGGKKGAAVAAGAHSGHGSSKQDIAKVQNSLEQQFYSGMKMKHDGQGHKRGLGA